MIIGDALGLGVAIINKIPNRTPDMQKARDRKKWLRWLKKGKITQFDYDELVGVKDTKTMEEALEFREFVHYLYDTPDGKAIIEKYYPEFEKDND